MNGILYYSKKKKKKMSKFLMQNIIVVYCACQKTKKFRVWGGEKVMNLLRRDYDKICVTVLMNYNPCNIISLPL